MSKTSNKKEWLSHSFLVGILNKGLKFQIFFLFKEILLAFKSITTGVIFSLLGMIIGLFDNE